MLSMPVKKYTIEQSEEHPDFLKVRIMAIKEGENLNESSFTLEGMAKCMESFIQKPLLIAYPKKMFKDEYDIGDGHNSFLRTDEDGIIHDSYLHPDAERCVGFVPHDSEISIENVDGSNWIVLTGLIWKAYNYELVKDIAKKKRVNGKSRISVEIEIISSFEENGIDILTEWRGLGITILNDKTQEAIVGANLVAYSESEKYENYKLAMSFALKKDNDKSALDYSVEDNSDKVVCNIDAETKDIHKKINSIYNKLGLNKEDEIVANEKDKEEFVEVEKMAEVETMAKVGTEDDGDKTVKMEVEKLAEDDTKKFEAFESEKAEMSAEIDRLKCEVDAFKCESDTFKLEMEAIKLEKEEMSLKLEAFEVAVLAEKADKFASEFKKLMEDEDELDDDEKAEMAKRFEANEFADIEKVEMSVAYAIRKKSKIAKDEEKKAFSVKIETPVTVDKTNMTAVEIAFDAVSKL